MAACEWCWKVATALSWGYGTPVIEFYRAIVDEQNALGANAQCPEMRQKAQEHGGE